MRIGRSLEDDDVGAVARIRFEPSALAAENGFDERHVAREAGGRLIAGAGCMQRILKGHRTVAVVGADGKPLEQLQTENPGDRQGLLRSESGRPEVDVRNEKRLLGHDDIARLFQAG